MKNFFNTLVLGSALLVSTVACAQTPAQTPGQDGGGHRHGRQEQQMTPEQRAQMEQKRLDRMKSELGLNDAQVGQIKTIFAQNQAKLDADRAAMKAAQKGSDQQKAAFQQMKTDREAEMAQVKSILTADQQAKWQQFAQKHEGHEGGRGGHGKGNWQGGANGSKS